MGDLQATTLTGRETTLQAAAVEAFQQSLRGQLIAPDDARYAGLRSWRRPPPSASVRRKSTSR